jgi:site-specific recombinase XerD
MTTELATKTAGGELVGAGDLAQNPAAVYLGSLATGSRRTMQGALDTMAAILGDFDAFSCPWSHLRFQHTAALRSQLAERYAAATANKMLSALRGVLKAAWRLGQMDAEDYTRAVDVGSMTGETLPAGRAIEAGELAALLKTCTADTTAAGARDAALLALLYSCGLRRAEATALDLSDYNPTTGAMTVRGKRNKERLAHVVNGSRLALADWLAIRGDDAGPLFLAVNKGGTIRHGQRLSTQAIYNAVQRRAAEAGVENVSCHDFRRTFVGDLLDAGADIATVQRLAGHASVNTTARYDRRPEEAKRKAAELLHVPYTRRENE